MEYEEIKKLMDDMGNSKLSSLDIEFPDGIKISMAKTVQNDISVVTAERITPTVVEIDSTKKEEQKDENLQIITSPMVGTFYSSDAPDKPAYVKVGDKINVKDYRGTRISYTIYNKFETNDQDTSFYQRETNGKAELTLSTCTDASNDRRLIILARQDD